MDPKLCREHLARLLNDEAAALTRLEVLLEKEHEILLENDVEQLDQAGELRQACVANLVRIEDERRSLCRAMNMSADLPGLQKLISWCDPSRTLQPRWAECAERGVRCRQVNERNGALVAARLKNVEGLLDVVTGRANQPKVYGRQGGYDSGGRSNTVLATV